MKEINIKRLTLVSLLSWLLSLLYIYAYIKICYCGDFLHNGCIFAFRKYDPFLLLCIMISGYIEVLIIYAASILSIKHIPYVFIKRFAYYGLWIIIFSCVEFYFTIEILHTKDAFKVSPIDMFFPPFFMKILFFIYYKLKEKQDYKKTQI